MVVALIPTAQPIVNGMSDASQFDPVRLMAAFALRPPIAELRASAAQSIPNNTWTAVTFDLEDVDDDVDGVGGHSTSSNTSQYVARYPGYYLLGGGVGFVANATGRRGCRFSVNSTTVQGSEALIAATAANGIAVPARTKLVYLGAGDIAELVAFQESGGALNTSTTTGGPSFTIAWCSSGQ